VKRDDGYLRTLRRAAEAAGNEERLAEKLKTSPELLRRWMTGELQPPPRVMLAAVQIVQLSITKPLPRRR
jgi:hypothetical protein